MLDIQKYQKEFAPMIAFVQNDSTINNQRFQWNTMPCLIVFISLHLIASNIILYELLLNMVFPNPQFKTIIGLSQQINVLFVSGN